MKKAAIEVSAATLAGLLDVTIQRLHQLAQQGLVIKAGRGRYFLVPSIPNVIRYHRDRAAKAASGSDDTALSRKRMADAQISELELERLRGNVLPAAEVEEMMQRVASTVRTNLLAVPSKVAPAAAGKSASAVEAVVRNAIDGALESLSGLATDQVSSASQNPTQKKGTES